MIPSYLLEIFYGYHVEDYFSKVIMVPVSLGKQSVILPAISFWRRLLRLDKNQHLSQGVGLISFAHSHFLPHFGWQEEGGEKSLSQTICF